MREVVLAGTDVVTSALGFGCAGLFRAPGSAERRRLLDAAHAAGIRHFDTAPMYGLGLAERELGRFARGRRADVVLATKFGIAPTAVAQAMARVQGPVRRALERSPALRRRAQEGAAGPSSGGAGGLLYRTTGYDGRAARASLERSLRALGTGHVDLLLLHDPVPGDVRSDDVAAALEAARAEGLLRAWGVAGEPGPVAAVAAALPDAVVLQVRDDVLAPGDPGAAITFGILGTALVAVTGHVGADAGRRARWHARVGRDCGDHEEVARLLLRLAARRSPAAVVLFSTIRPAHAAAAVAAVDAPEGDDLDAFAVLLAEDGLLQGAAR